MEDLKELWIFYDYPANQQLLSHFLNSAIKVILKELHKIYLMNRNGKHTRLMRLKKSESENERNRLYP
jgi:hypothetical protein